MGDELRASRADGMLTLTLDRPAVSNALDAATVEAAIAALDSVTPDVRLVVLRGNGSNFCAGFDLSDLETASDSDLLWRFVRIETLLQRLFHAPFQTLALVQGRVVGAGVDLFAACARRIAAPGTTFRMPGWQFGVALGTRRLVHRVGADAARDVLIASRTFDAEHAKAIGLAHRIVPEVEWPHATEDALCEARTLSAEATADLFALANSDTRDSDMAALLATAGRPGLKARILHYRDRLKQQKRA